MEGRVRWVNSSDTGREFIQSIIEPGQCFGELPLFDDLPYAASALADMDSVIIRLPKSSFLHLVKHNSELLFSFARMLVQRIRFKFLLIKELACYTPEHQIITLLDHYKNYNGNGSNSPYRVSLTRQQMADMTGLRVETVIRAIKKLQQNGQLTINKGKVYY